MENRSRYKDGFSLIEVIVAVAILAILSMPILLYFTNSAIQSANGKHEQSADMAAQSVVEELDAMDSFSVFENKANLEKANADLNEGWKTDDEHWKIADPFAADPTDKMTTELWREVSVNEEHYMAKVTIDYGRYSVDDGSSSDKPKYNAYNMPQLKELHSDASVVIADKANIRTMSNVDEAAGEEVSSYIETGIRDFYHRLNGDDGTTDGSKEIVSLADIRSKTVRKFFLKVDEELGGADGNTPTGNYIVKGGYQLVYSDGVHAAMTSDVIITNKMVDANSLNNIFFLYYPKRSEVVVTAPPVDALISLPTDYVTGTKKIGINFIWQKSEIVPTNAYKISAKAFSETAALNYDNIEFHTNKPVEITTATNEYRTELLMKEKKKRIADVKVDIYSIDNWDQEDANILATSTTSKAI